MAALAAILFVTSAHAITLDNGDLAYQPDGTMLGVLYQHYFSGDELYAKGQKISDNAKLTVDVTMLRGVWYRDWGESVGIVPQFLLPIGKARTGGALSAVDSTNGAGDLLLVLPIHFIKDPTGQDAKPLIFWLWLPTGHYDKSRGLNPFAENRWKFAVQTGRMWKVGEKLSLEVSGDAQIHGDNDDFSPAGVTMKQNTLWEAQAHLRYLLGATTFFGALVSHSKGGETRLNDVAQDDRQKRSKVLFSVGHMLTPKTQLIASVGQDLSIRTGVKEDKRFNLRLLRFF